MKKLAILFAVLTPISMLCQAGVAHAQTNLLKDSGFEKGLGAWSVSGGKFYAGLEKVDCDGDGVKSQCLSVTPDWSGNAFVLSQKVPLVKGRRYWLRMAVRGTGSLSASNTSYVKDQAGYQSIAHFKGNGRLYEHVLVFSPSANSASLNLQLYTASRARLGFKINIDNIELYEMKSLPWSKCDSVRNLNPTSIKMRTFGKPSSLYLIWLGQKRLSMSVKIPGIGGLFEMDPSGGMVVVSTGVIHRVRGYDDVTLPLPAAVLLKIKGRPLYWMPVQVTSLPTTVTIGKTASWGFL